jgi:aryl-alcohol dehydrogenase-like predicted oxidoreductase
MRLVEWFDRYADSSRAELMLRYVLSNPDLDCALVGTANVEHLESNIALADKGPLSSEVLADFRAWITSV